MFAFCLRRSCSRINTISTSSRQLNARTANPLILGIETSCDDTGCAIVNAEGRILGDALNSQHLIHLNNGGIIPPIAQDLHKQNIENVVNEALEKANVTMNDIDGVATTVKPGLPMSLLIGTKYGKYLCRTNKKPFIPIHHMEAHALTARMHDKTISYPFLVLLISGGHCLLAIAQNVDKFLLLGESLDDAPGEAFDKMARRMKLKNIPEFSTMSGGQVIEQAAKLAKDPSRYNITVPLLPRRDCNFSVTGPKNQLLYHLKIEEKKYDVPPDGLIPGVYDLCAAFLICITKHLCHRVQRAMEFAALEKLIPQEQQTLVVSGGVASNDFIANALQIVCDEMGYKFVRPPHHLCTDNGIMIAWNGMERWQANVGIYTNFDDIKIEKSCPLGENIIEKVTDRNIKCKWVKLNKLIT